MLSPTNSAVPLELLRGGHHVRRLGAARRAPRAPHDDHSGLAPEVRERQRIAVEVLALELDRVASVLGRDLR